MKFLSRKRKYSERAREAEQEVALSRKRLEDTRRNIAGPLTEAKRRNQFAQIIRATITNGYHHERA